MGILQRRLLSQQKKCLDLAVIKRLTPTDQSQYVILSLGNIS